jgi:DNA topoisomerase-6 subunit B
MAKRMNQTKGGQLTLDMPEIRDTRSHDRPGRKPVPRKPTSAKRAIVDEGPSLLDLPDAPQAAPQTEPADTGATVPESPAAAGPNGNGSTEPAHAPPRRKAVVDHSMALSLATKQREISVSEFFAKNRHLLGFDNKRKALLTSVKEAVDNSLDACEEAGILPDIEVDVKQLDEDRFRISVQDNGPGILKAQIPNVFGKLLYGSKFHRLKMSRGQQGIGISAAGMYGLLTTGKPVRIVSRTGQSQPAHEFELRIDTAKNKPDIIKNVQIEVDWPHGTQVQIEMTGSYNKGRQSVDEYMFQTAIANPHARFVYRSPVNETFTYERASEHLPPQPQEIRPHPYGIDLGLLLRMLKETSDRRLTSFLQNNFSRVSAAVAKAICKHARLNATDKPHSLSLPQAEALYQGMQKTRIMAPPTDCVSPIGARQILAGLLQGVKAEFYTAVTREPTVYRGNPFQIEVGLSYGGQLPAEEPAKVLRFANRVPLLYQQSACSIFKAVADTNWRNYELQQPNGSPPVGPLMVMVHMASVWVPFTSESKEAIADYDEIAKEIRLALQECGRKLSGYLRKRKKQQREGLRRSVFIRYIQEVVEAVNSISSIDRDRFRDDLIRIAQSRTQMADVQLDEDGRPIVPEETGPEPADDGDVIDDTTIVVAQNQQTPPAAGAEGDLFTPANGGNGHDAVPADAKPATPAAAKPAKPTDPKSAKSANARPAGPTSAKAAGHADAKAADVTPATPAHVKARPAGSKAVPAAATSTKPGGAKPGTPSAAKLAKRAAATSAKPDIAAARRAGVKPGRARDSSAGPVGSHTTSPLRQQGVARERAGAKRADAKADRAADPKPADAKPPDAKPAAPAEAKPESAAVARKEAPARKIPVVTAPREAMSEARVPEKRKAS